LPTLYISKQLYETILIFQFKDENMIQKANAIETFQKNIERTDMLITAMEKIGAYNRIYQYKAYEINSEYGRVVTESQNKELIKIEQFCAEHAIISLATAFETYIKELLQQLLYSYPAIFLCHNTKYDSQIRELLTKRKKFDYEQIEEVLKLKNRFDYFDIFKIYSISLLTPEESQFIEYIYIKRNCFVHNAGKIDKKTKLKFRKIPSPIEKTYLTTESKRLRTEMKKLIKNIDGRIKKTLDQ